MGLFLIGLLGLLLWGQGGTDRSSEDNEDYFDRLKRTDYGKWKAMKDDSEKPRW